MKNKEHYYYTDSNDRHELNKINLTTMELKVIYNHFIDVLEDIPEMVTYKSVVDKIKERLDDDCKCDYFYGVNDINNMDWTYSEGLEGVQIAVDVNVQSTQTSESEDMVLFFSPEQIDIIKVVDKEMRKSYKKLR